MASWNEQTEQDVRDIKVIRERNIEAFANQDDEREDEDEFCVCDLKDDRGDGLCWYCLLEIGKGV